MNYRNAEARIYLFHCL
uniref:Uncharacterized protein n=1 Tax=Arundo donax TaxID=35708 RepID=A0A0A9BJA9_ARUDO